MKFQALLFGLLLVTKSFGFVLEGGVIAAESGAFVAEATEIIGVVRIGVSLVDYIYKGNEW